MNESLNIAEPTPVKPEVEEKAYEIQYSYNQRLYLENKQELMKKMEDKAEINKLCSETDPNKKCSYKNYTPTMKIK